ncbi:ATP synthase F1 subunit gamma [Desulfovibrio sp. OttesenSCG-928-C14]|nr:ATP synthase F1 subunit gamma [Desulfovibrio sp. OttesenSCG-928-C14]
MALKDVKMKIAGVRKTKQITKAMNMVSSAKLRGAQQRIERFSPYADKFREMLLDLSAQSDAGAHPLLEVRAEPKKTGIILVTSDRGLCGSYNASLIQTALKLGREKAREGREVTFYCAGRKGRDAVRKQNLKNGWDPILTGSYDFTLAASMGEHLIRAFLDGELDEVFLVNAKFVSVARQVPMTVQLLPIAPPKNGGQGAPGEERKESSFKNYLYEPDAISLLAELLPRYLKVQTYRALLDNSASEHAARMAAMDNATRNCDEIVNSLTLLYNKTRQGSITTELIDIVSGAGALEG